MGNLGQKRSQSDVYPYLLHFSQHPEAVIFSSRYYFVSALNHGSDYADPESAASGRQSDVWHLHSDKPLGPAWSHYRCLSFQWSEDFQFFNWECYLPSYLIRYRYWQMSSMKRM